jgi:hypothetical protein
VKSKRIGTTAMVVAAAAMTGLLAGASAARAAAPSADTPLGAAVKARASGGKTVLGHSGLLGKNAFKADTDTASCKGKNDCKGKGGCKTDKHDCKGKNDCKGQGGCKATPAPAPEPPKL